MELTAGYEITEDDIKMARATAKKYALDRGLFRMIEELTGAAMLGLVEAARSFDGSFGWKFQSFASRRVLGAILDEARRQELQGYRRNSSYARAGRLGHRPNVVSIDWQPDGGGGNARYNHNALEVPDGGPLPGEDLAAVDEVRRLTRGLPPKERDAVRLAYLDAGCVLIKDVGRALGVCESRASQLLKSAHERLREMHATPARNAG